MATGEQSGKRKSDTKAPGHKSIEIARQIEEVQQLLVGFHSAREIRQILAERYGLPARTADHRIKAAREGIRSDVNAQDRQDVAAMMMEQCLKIAKEAGETRQLSNAIGAMRLYGEILGVTGANRV